MNEHTSTVDQNSQNDHTLADIYTLLAMTASYPDTIHQTKDFFNGFLALLDVLGWSEERAHIQEWYNQSDHPLESLQLEYTRLFINAVPHVIAPPYASVYLDGDSSIQGKSTEKTYDYYRQCGFELSNKTEPPDHIQNELYFLAELVREGRYHEEETFLKNYFRPWFTLFADRVLQETGHPFYRVSMQLIDFFTKEEQ